MHIKISSRQSDLAKLQSYSVGSALQAVLHDVKIDYNFKQSLGDINLTDPLWKMPEKGVFTEDFYHDLIQGKTDLVVHSWKDLPVEEKENTRIVASLPRADQRDLFLVKKSHLDTIKKNKKLKLYSSSPRRSYNLEPFFKDYYPCTLDDVQFISVRGNIPTRLNKYISDDNIDGIILAKAALDRLLSATKPEMTSMQTELRDILQQSQWMVLPLSENPNAAAQGCLAIEIRSDRQDLINIISNINNGTSYESAQKEREILKSYGGGCHQKIGVAVVQHQYGKITVIKGQTDQNMILKTLSLSHPGQEKIFKQFLSQDLWSIESARHFFNEYPENWRNQKSSNIFVSKSAGITIESLPELHKAPVVWSAGNMTWKKLAKMGVWVNGSNESFGEDFPMQIEHLAEEKTSWIKLTHKDSSLLNSHSRFEGVPCYRIERNTEPFNIKNQTCFFWNSSSLFFAAISEHPEIIDATHCCAPGNTAQNLQRYLDHKFGTNTLWSKLFVFLNQEQWRSYVTK